jgi:hypothetical protein
VTVEPMWHIVDERTGRRASVAAYSTRESAEAQIERWRERDRRGVRQDVHELMPHLAAALCEADH